MLRVLCEALGPSGHEGAVREVILEHVAPLADEVHVDTLGNVIARRHPAGKSTESRRIMLTAHMDEIGVIVSHIDQNGFVRFAGIGGAPDRYAEGVHVRFSNGVVGVLGHDRPRPGDSYPPVHRMYIDVGAGSRETCPVKVGDTGGFEGMYMEMGEKLVAKSLGSRIGVTVLIAALKESRSSANDLYFVFTVQGEVGMRGAGPAAFGIDPQIGVVVDVTRSGDTPGSPIGGIELGKGPCIRIRDEEMIVDPRLVQWMTSTAEEAHIPFQPGVGLSGVSEALVLQQTRAGVLAGALSIPARYVHSSSEMVDFRDVSNTVNLVGKLGCQPVRMRGTTWG